MTTPTTKPQLYTFLAPAQIAPESESAQPGVRAFSGIAYSGGIITDHGFFSRVAFDLASITLDTPAPLLLEHDREDTIGVITSATMADGIRITGSLFTGIDKDAAAVAAKADAGFPWQMSVGIFPGSVEEIAAEQSIALNGAVVTGPLTVFRNARIREVSFTALGADDRTLATVFTAEAEPLSPPQEPSMADKPTDESAVIDALKGQIADTEKQLAERDATIQSLQTQISEFHAAQRDAEIQALFSALGREYTAEAGKPYRDMTAEQFTAISADLKAMRPTAPGHLFSAVATGSLPTVDARKAAESLNAQVAGAK